MFGLIFCFNLKTVTNRVTVGAKFNHKLKDISENLWEYPSRETAYLGTIRTDGIDTIIQMENNAQIIDYVYIIRFTSIIISIELYRCYENSQ